MTLQTRRPLRATATALAALTLGPAHAGLPLITEDAGIIEPRGCEVEAASFSLRVRGASALDRGIGLQCGLGFDSQAGVAVSRAQATGDASLSGLALGGKTNVWRSESGAAATVAWAADWVRGGGGSGWQSAGYALNGVYSRPLPGTKDLTLHANLGHAYDRLSRTRSTTWAAALEHAGYAVGGLTLAPMGEVFGDDRSAPFASAALRTTVVPERFWIGLSYGRQLGDERARLATASGKLAF